MRARIPGPPSREHAPLPVWRACSRACDGRPDAGIRRWLLDEGSLTARLRRHYRGQFEVRRPTQSWRYVTLADRQLLGIAERRFALVREVILVGAGRPVVFARSVFPRACFAGELAHLQRLRNQPLGHILFKYPGMRRSPFEVARIAGNSGYLPEQLHQQSTAWGRRSAFTVCGVKLMVSEVFLEAFEPWSGHASPPRRRRVEPVR